LLPEDFKRFHIIPLPAKPRDARYNDFVRGRSAIPLEGAAGAGKSIQSQERTEGYLTKPDGKGVVSDFGTRVGADGTLSRALGSAKENNYALESLKGYIVYIVWGCWE